MSIYSELSKAFPKEQLATFEKGRTSLTYVPISEVIARLNNVLGVENWSVIDIQAERDKDDPDWIIAKATLEFFIEGRTRTAVGYGGQKIKRSNKDNAPVDLGDEFKGAASDAIKKAAQQVGVGLELARRDEALAYEEEESIPKAPQEDIDAIKAYVEGLDETALTNFKDFWKRNIGVKLDSGRVTVEHVALVKDNFGI